MIYHTCQSLDKMGKRKRRNQSQNGEEVDEDRKRILDETRLHPNSQAAQGAIVIPQVSCQSLPHFKNDRVAELILHPLTSL